MTKIILLVLLALAGQVSGFEFHRTADVLQIEDTINHTVLSLEGEYQGICTPTGAEIKRADGVVYFIRMFGPNSISVKDASTGMLMEGYKVQVLSPDVVECESSQGFGKYYRQDYGAVLIVSNAMIGRISFNRNL
jgi:hypothetical protein